MACRRRPWRICTRRRCAHHRDLRASATRRRSRCRGRASPSRCTRRRTPCAARRRGGARSPRRTRARSSAPWRIMPRHSRSRPGSKPGVSTNVMIGRLNASHHCDEARRLARRLDVERAGAVHRLVGDDADRRGRRARPSPVTRFGAYAARSSRKESLVEHVVDDGRARRTTRSGAPGTAAAARVAGRSTGSSASSTRRIGEMVVGEVREQRGERVSASSSSATTSAATPLCAVVHRRAAELGRATIGTPVNVGDRRRARSRTRTRRRSSPRGRASRARAPGPDTHGPTTASTSAPTPDASTSARATRPHACSAATPSPSSAPDVSSSPTSGMPQLAREVHRRARRSRRRRCRSRRGACRRRGGTS